MTRDDARLVSDIEKLIKKKLELEAFELEDDRRRSYRRRDDDDERREADRASAPRRHVTSAKPADPFFDKPYEPAALAEPAAWERAPTPSTSSAVSGATARHGNGLSPNIRPKKKVASLLGG